MSTAVKKDSIYVRLARIQSSVGSIHKDANNPFHKSKYESLEAILNALNPLLSKEGLALFNNVEHEENIGLVLKTTLTDGNETVSAICPLAADGKNMMQAYGSAISYSRRYNLRNMFNLITTDDDGEGAYSEPKLTRVKEKKVSARKGPYIIPNECTAFAGKKFSELKKGDMNQYINKITDQLVASNRDFPDWFEEMLDEFQKYVEEK